MIAILAAIVLAVLSPSDPAAPGQAGAIELASPAPLPSVLAVGVPTAKPSIVTPEEGRTHEIDINVVVEVPEEELPRKLLTLVVLSGDTEIGSKENPKLGTVETVKGARLLEGVVNEVTVALKTEAGLGPRSDPVLVTHDEDAPTVAITSPEDGLETWAKAIMLTGTSEAGAKVRISNKAAGWGPKQVRAGPTGEFEMSVRVEIGKNVIAVVSEDEVKQKRRKEVRVTRLDGRPTLTVTQKPGRLKRSSLPTEITVKVEVTNDKGEKMSDATVDFTLGSQGYPGRTGSAVTGANGKATWETDVPWSDSLQTSIPVTVTATSPSGDTAKETWDIQIN